MAEQHWSTSNGCHPDCPACEADAEVVDADYYGHAVVLSNFRVVTVVRDKTMGNHAVYVGNTKRWSAQVIDASVLEHVLGSSPFTLRSASVTLGPDVKFPDTLDACMSLDMDAVKSNAATSRAWAAAFVEKNNRFPHAIDYADAGYGTGSQCDCTTVGECVLRDACNGHSCDRNCYAQQLKDYIALSNTKRTPTKVEERRPATAEALLAKIRTMITGTANSSVRIPLWAEGLLLQAAHHDDVRSAFTWQADSWRPKSIYGLQCIWETGDLGVE